MLINMYSGLYIIGMLEQELETRLICHGQTAQISRSSTCSWCRRRISEMSTESDAGHTHSSSPQNGWRRAWKSEPGVCPFLPSRRSSWLRSCATGSDTSRVWTLTRFLPEKAADNKSPWAICRRTLRWRSRTRSRGPTSRWCSSSSCGPLCPCTCPASGSSSPPTRRTGSGTGSPGPELSTSYHVDQGEGDAEQQDVLGVSLLETCELRHGVEEVDLVGEHQDGQAHHECQYSPDSFCSLKYVKNERWKISER